MSATDSNPRLADLVPSAAALPSWLAWPGFPRVARVLGAVPQGLLALAIYLTVFIVGFALPVAGHLGEPRVRQDWTDPNFYTWAMRWWPYAITHGLNPLYTTQIGAPHGYSLAWVTTTPAISLLFWPVTAAFGVIVAYNLMLLLVVPVTAWAAFTLARRLTGRFWASLLAGAVYGFSPFELWHSLQGQPNLTVITLFPLMAYLVLRWWEGTLRTPWYIGCLAAALAVEFYTFTEAFADLTIVGAAALAIGFLVAGRAAWRTMGKLTLHTAIAYACALVLAAPYLSYAFTHYSTALVRQRNTFSLSLVRLILPPSGRDFGLTSLVDYSNVIGRYSIDDYVGVPLLLVLLGLAVFAWRSRLARLLALGFALVIALAVGPGIVVGTKTLAGLPWAGLWRLPILRSAEPSRFIIFGYLILAIALALWLAAPSKTWLCTAGRWGLGLLAVAVVFADLPTFSIAVPPEPAGVVAPAGTHPTDRLPAFFTDGLYRNYLTPGETIVIVTHRGNGGMLFQADANFYFRIAGGFINTSLTPQDAIPVPVALLTYAHRDRVLGFERYVRAANVGAIVVENAWAERWTSVFAKIGMHGTSVGGVTVYPTVFGPPPQQAAAQPSRLTSPDQRHGHPR